MYTFDPNDNFESWAITLRSQNWIIPPYIKKTGIQYLVQAINNAPADKKHDTLAKSLKLIYTPEYISSMYLDRYKLVPALSEFSEIISEGIQAFYAGLIQAAVSTLVPVIEGIVTRMATQQGLVVTTQKEKMRRSIEVLVDQQQNQTPRNDEFIVMLKAFWLFINQDMFANTQNYTGIGNLNRHGILHGLFSDHQYEHEFNFYKIISVIDLLCFVNTILNPNSVSLFAPGDSIESIKLAGFYRSLSLCSVGRKLVKS